MGKDIVKGNSKEIRLIVRADDMGMTHACNVAVEKCFEEGILTCAAILAVAPWAEEAAKMAREHPSWCIGVHMSVIGEWRGYRWRPVLPYTKVPSLVDKNGFLHKTPKDFFAGKPDYDELEQEFRAQVELISNKWGVKLGYLDTHYIGGPEDKLFNKVVKKVAKSYNLPVSDKINEKRMPGVYREPVWMKEAVLAGNLEKLTPGLWLLVTHLLVESVDSSVLVHTEPKEVMVGGLGNLRAAETKCLLSDKTKEVIVRRKIKLVDYNLY
jgi:predicted glycoside hydrolase/deacetylase ChbG (UPF0249 family)